MQLHTTVEVIKNCRDEATLNRVQERGYCFELFRRALDQRDEVAWEAIQTQYLSLIQHWIQLAATTSLTSQQEADLTQEVLKKFWGTLTTAPQVIEQKFEHIGSVLKYLRQCSMRSVYTLQRQQQKERRLQEKLQYFHEVEVVTFATLEDDEAQQAHQRHLQRMKELLADKVQDPVEQRLLHLYFERGLKPAEISASYPQDFPKTRDVYRIKERVLKRLRRAMTAEDS